MPIFVPRTYVNAAMFAVRRTLRWSRGRPALKNESKANLFDYLDGHERHVAEQREHEIRLRFGLDRLYAGSTRLDYRDNIYLLDALERITAGMTIAQRSTRTALIALDIGSAKFHYAFALEKFFRMQLPEGAAPKVTGVEVDGYLIYPNGYSRFDFANAYAGQTENPDVAYQVCDFASWPAEPLVDVITWFFPFLTPRALLAWGLPMTELKPEVLVAKALSLLHPGGLLIAMTQTDDEALLLTKLVGQLGGRVERSEPIWSKLVAYWEQTEDREGLLIRRGD